MNELRMVYRELPPSSNSIYVKGTILSSKARAYGERFAAWAIQNHGPELLQLGTLHQEALYSIELWFFFESLVNEAYYSEGPTYVWEEKVKDKKTGKLVKTGKTEVRRRSPWKKFDLTNRVKLLEDCVRDAVDIDDSQTIDAHLFKRQDAEAPRVEIILRPFADLSPLGLAKR